MKDKLNRWDVEVDSLRHAGGCCETVLDYWWRMERAGQYQLLPKVPKVVLAVPASSAQMERDFGISGTLARDQRGSLSSAMVDRCAFVSRN